jgi:hypothetical protein
VRAIRADLSEAPAQLDEPLTCKQSVRVGMGTGRCAGAGVSVTIAARKPQRVCRQAVSSQHWRMSAAPTNSAMSTPTRAAGRRPTGDRTLKRPPTAVGGTGNPFVGGDTPRAPRSDPSRTPVLTHRPATTSRRAAPRVLRHGFRGAAGLRRH